MKTKYRKIIKKPKEQIINNKVKLYVKYGNILIETKRLNCSFCGAPLNVKRISEDGYKLCPCKKCLPNTTIPTLKKLKSMLDENVNAEEIYKNMNKIKTDKIVNMYSLEEKRKQTEILRMKLKEKGNKCQTTCIEYYLNKGMSQEEAKEALKNRQRTFTKEKCIAKYGEEEGLKVWQARQDKWQNTLNSKSNEEKIRIQNAKFINNGYSKISQELFWDIYKELKDKEILKIYFATKDIKTNEYTTKNNEFALLCENNVYKLDFYIPYYKLCIEFDGNYWHNNRTKINDIERCKKIEEKGIKILHILEKDYRMDKKKILNKCLEWINENKNRKII